MRFRRCVVICAVVGAVACGNSRDRQSTEVPTGSITRAAADATQRGEPSTIIYAASDERPVGLSPDDVLRLHSTIVATITPVTATSHTADTIFTWSGLSDVRVLQRREPVELLKGNCQAPVPQTVRDTTSAALGLFGGTHTVDGVAVTLETAQTPAALQPSNTYLMVVVRCGESGPFFLPYGFFGTFRVSDGRVEVPSERTDPLATQLRGLEYLERIENYLSGVRGQ